MKLLVCIKQVPATQQVEVDPETGVLKRDGVSSKINPYDLYALEAQLTLRERLGGEITVLSMGPNQAAGALREALWMGADPGRAAVGPGALPGCGCAGNPAIPFLRESGLWAALTLS